MGKLDEAGWGRNGELVTKELGRGLRGRKDEEEKRIREEMTLRKGGKREQGGTGKDKEGTSRR